VSLEIIARAGNHALARLTLSIHGTEKSIEAEGVGPVDATFKGIEAICQSVPSWRSFPSTTLRQALTHKAK